MRESGHGGGPLGALGTGGRSKWRGVGAEAPETPAFKLKEHPAEASVVLENTLPIRDGPESPT